MDLLEIKRNLVTRRRSSVNSVASEPVIPLSRKTPFTLRSQCARHGSECREGHGITFQRKLRASPRSEKKSPQKIIIEDNESVKRKLEDTFSKNASEINEKPVQYEGLYQTKQINHRLSHENQINETKNNNQMIDTLSAKPHNPTELDEKLCQTPKGNSMPVKLSPLQRYLICYVNLLIMHQLFKVIKYQCQLN